MKLPSRQLAILLIALITLSLTHSAPILADTTTISTVMPYETLTSEQLTKDMGAGWNLGNTMDGHTGFTPNETLWQNVKTTKQLIKSVHDLGFNTIRIPVTWGNMIEDDNNYSINESWISRVQDIVDYCVSLDMYAIINIHHDGAEQMGWLRIASSDLDSVKEKYAGVWNTISTRFKDYDQHVIFESMNEVKGEAMTVIEENKVIMELNQIFVDTIRKTGSNNEKRWLVVTGKYNFIDSVCNEENEFSLPNDSIANRLIVSVHDYTPWSFCGQESTSDSDYTLSELQYNQKELKPLYEKYTSKGVPVIVGEYGCVNKGNTAERAYYIEGMNRIYQQYNLVGIYWDQGWYDRSLSADYSFSIIDRNTGEPIEKEITDALMRGLYVNGASDLSDIVKNPTVTSFTAIKSKVTALSMNVGERKQLTITTEPESSNDVVLYKSSDESVVTVAYGKLHATGSGTAIITIFSQSGSSETTVEVTVSDASASVPSTDLSISQTDYSLSVGEAFYLSVTKVPENSDDFLYYRSSDEAVATVSRTGKIVATGQGSATITILSSGGVKKEVTVTCGATESIHQFQLALNVYYNDNANEFYQNEVSSNIITVSENGQYTLTFDCTKDLSQAAKDSGVTTLSGLSAIYIKDYLVTTGEKDSSPLQSCNIAYDFIAVNGKLLTITNLDAKSALKSSGIFDSNDPINFWDGSLVEEVGWDGFVGINKPTQISVTFTLSDIVFSDGTKAETKNTTPSSENETPSPTPTSTTVSTPLPIDTVNKKEDGSSAPLILGIVLGILLLGSGASLWYRKRKTK